MGKKNKKINTILGIVLAIVVAVAIFGCIYVAKKSVKSNLNEIVEELNKQVPVRIDDDTRMIKAKLTDSNTLKYTFDLINLDTKAAKLRFTDPEKNLLKKRIVDNLKNNVQSDFFKKNKINFDYTYRSNSGEELFTIEVSYKDYK